MAENKLVQVFASLDLLQEIHRVLEYEKIQRILKQSRRAPNSIMATVVSLSTLVDVRSTVHAIQEDPTDNQLLACAKDATAQFIVSGDRHLLQLGEYENIKILTATSFLEKHQFS